jgi:hypothetical protein
METHSQIYLEQLPLELRQEILSLIPDVGTLRTAALSCPTFYYAFRGSPASITTSVLLSEIGPAILPEATMVLEASSIHRRNPSVQDMLGPSGLGKYWLQREKVRREWTPADALSASKLHFYVHSFGIKLASTALSKIPSHRGQQPPPTRQELERIKRALYRFQVYRHISPPRSYGEYMANADRIEMLHEIFFSKFATWENEQLACIYDFLVEEVRPGKSISYLETKNFANHIQLSMMWCFTTLCGVTSKSGTRMRSTTLSFKDFLPTVYSDFMILLRQIHMKLVTSYLKLENQMRLLMGNLEVMSQNVAQDFSMSRSENALTISALLFPRIS